MIRQDIVIYLANELSALLTEAQITPADHPSGFQYAIDFALSELGVLDVDIPTYVIPAEDARKAFAISEFYVLQRLKRAFAARFDLRADSPMMYARFSQLMKNMDDLMAMNAAELARLGVGISASYYFVKMKLGYVQPRTLVSEFT